jgi:hypothetical protein
LGSRIILFCVGDRYEEASVHEKKLCDQSLLFKHAFQLPKDQFLPYLQRRLGKDTKVLDANGAICLLPGSEFRLQDVATLVEFLYSPILPNELSFSAFRRLYILADKFNMPGVLNKLLDHTQEKYATSGAIFDPKEIISIYSIRTAGNGNLWKYCCAQVIGSWQSGMVESSWAEKFKQTCYNQNAMLKDMMMMQINEGAVISSNELVRQKILNGERGICQFHIHEEGGVCGKEAEESRSVREVDKTKQAENIDIAEETDTNKKAEKSKKAKKKKRQSRTARGLHSKPEGKKKESEKGGHHLRRTTDKKERPPKEAHN